MKEPKIRFKGFSGEWVNTKFSSLAKIKRGLTYSPNHVCSQGVRVLRSSNIDKDTFVCLKDDVFVSPECVNVPFAIEGDILITAANGSSRLVGKHAVIEKLKGEKVVPGGFMVLASTHEPYFLNSCMSSPWYRRFLKIGVAGGNGAIGNLNKNALEDTDFYIPGNNLERNNIASFFTSLDAQLSASTSRLASLKQMKAASLQTMFPQEGETVPKVRFKGFEGEWEKVKFDKAFSFLKNNSLSRAELCNDGDIINIHYGDVLIKYGDILDIGNDEVIYVADSNVANKLYTDCPIVNGDIIIADAAEDFTVGKCVEVQNVTKQKIVSGLHTIPCRPLESTAPNFWGYYINSNSFHRQLLPMIQGSKISSISKTSLSATYVVFPVVEEQQFIASFFTSLDRQIALHTQRLEKLKQIKAACLDKMFV